MVKSKAFDENSRKELIKTLKYLREKDVDILDSFKCVYWMHYYHITEEDLK